MKLLVPLLVTCLLLVSCARRTTDEEAAAYASQLEFRNIRAGASGNFAGQTVTYIKMDVHNRGRRAVKHVEVLLSFRDTQGKEVLRERAVAVSPRTRPLGPGQTRGFQLGFDIPADWDRRQPSITIARLVLE